MTEGREGASEVWGREGEQGMGARGPRMWASDAWGREGATEDRGRQVGERGIWARGATNRVTAKADRIDIRADKKDTKLILSHMLVN